MTLKQIQALIKKWPHSIADLAASIPCHERTIYKWQSGTRKPHKGMIRRLRDVVEAESK